MEEWRDIKGFEGYYQASNSGQIRSVDRFVLRKDGRYQICKGRILRPFQGTTCNYLSIQFSKDNIPSKHLIHRLIAYTFLDLNPESKLEVNHKDGNRHNNSVDNLEIVTHQQNIDHSIRTGLKNDYGENHKNAKITNADAEEMRQMWRRGVLQKDIAECFGVSKQLVNCVINYKTYIR